MARIFYLEIELKRAQVTLRKIQRHSKAKWMEKPLQDYMRQLQYEKQYLYSRLMKEKVY